MMRTESEELHLQLRRVERRLRLTQIVAGTGAALFAVLAVGGWTATGRDVIRARGVIIEDAAGRPRILLGAPVPDPSGGQRISPSTGILINDSSGAERFGVGVMDNGMLSMGFDAPPGTGPGALERITFSVNASGGSEFRFLDHGGRVRSHMVLFSDNTVALFFTEPGPDTTFVYRVSAKGDTRAVHVHD